MSSRDTASPMRFGLVAAGAAVLVAGPVFAQTTPPELRDLVGARGSSGENALQARGYVSSGCAVGDDRVWTYWWNGRHDSIVSPHRPIVGVLILPRFGGHPC